MRAVAMLFQVWLSRRIGTAGIGLFQLIMSVSSLAATVAISGIRFAATRLISMQLGFGAFHRARAAMKRCLLYALVCGCFAAAVLYLGAPTIGYRWIGDARTILSLRLLSLSLPFFALTAVIAGYFTAVTRVIKSAAVQFAEQGIRIAFVVAALTRAQNLPLERSCAVVIAGGVCGEIAAFIMLYVLYVSDRRKIPPARGDADGITREMFHIAVPLALSAYARTALTTLQNMLIPRGFRKFGASSEKALSDYGLITGMVFPIITFPQSLFHALSEMLVPELTDAEARGDRSRIGLLMKRTLTGSLLFSVAVMTLMIALSEILGNAIYHSGEAGRYIRRLAWVVPIMYTDSVTDGMLRGLGLQVYSMGVNIADALLSVILVWIMLPRFGVDGYIFIVYFSEIFNFVLSIGKLLSVTAGAARSRVKLIRGKPPKAQPKAANRADSG
jgi:stage V sporulation protein B